MTAKFFDEFAQKFREALPPPLAEMNRQFEKQFQKALEVTFNKLNLITREEFDIQAEVLMRTRKKVEQLENRLEELEKNG